MDDPSGKAKGGLARAKSLTADRRRQIAVDAARKMLTVSNENVEGWMAPMQMMYKADKDDVYSRVKPGDQITARVYDGIEDMLYDVQVIPSQK